MHKYSPAAITYISLNILSLLLLTVIIIKLYISPNHFTKYTQLQLFIAAWGYTIGFLPAIIKYGDDIINQEFEGRVSICMIQQTISLFFFYPLYIFPIILGFYIWHAIGKRNIKIEKKYFWAFSSLTWCFTACFNVFSFADGYVNGHFDTRVTPLLCKPPNSMLHRITYLIVIPPLFCMALAFIWFASAMLWKRWQSFSVKKNRWTALRLGHALRFFICSVMYTIFIGISLSSRIMTQYVENSELNNIVIEDYVQPFSGIILFLIFIKSDSPTVFLPCFYYGGPENLTFKSESYIRADSYLYARPPSFSSPSNQPPNTIIRQGTSSTAAVGKSVSISIDKTNNDVNEIEEIV